MLCLGLLTGIVKVLGKGRLKMSFSVDDCNVDQEETEKSDIIKEEIKNLVEMAATSEGLVNMRVKSDQSDMFDTFVNYCLVNFTTSLNWKYNHITLTYQIFSLNQMKVCVCLSLKTTRKIS